jgi:hypothetical protein
VKCLEEFENHPHKSEDIKSIKFISEVD